VQAAYDQLTKQKVTIFGVSTDNAPTQRKFCNKHSLKYSLIADTNKKVTTAFKVPLIKSKLASRQAYLFYNGVLVWRDPHFS